MRRWLWMAAAVFLAVVTLRARGLAAAPVISRVPTSEKVVALTFDDGPEAPYTGQILALLRQYHDRATFFVLGNKATQYPNLIREEARAHMELALHGMTHLNLRRVGAVFMVQDALKERAFLRTIAPGAALDLFRSPYGYQSKALAANLAAQRMELVLWDVDTRDWMRPGVEFIVRQVEKLTKPGSIILFHDGGGNRSETVAALARILPWLKANGYRLVTVRGLLQQAGT